MFDPEDSAFILEMYQYAYPKLSDSSIIQLIELESKDFLSKIATLKMAADNGFSPEIMHVVKEKFNANFAEMWKLAMGTGVADERSDK